MATAPAKTADDLADSIKQLVDRVVDAKFTHEMTKRGQELAGVIAEAVQERGTEVTEAAAATGPRPVEAPDRRDRGCRGGRSRRPGAGRYRGGAARIEAARGAPLVRVLPRSAHRRGRRRHRGAAHHAEAGLRDATGAGHARG